MLKSIPQKWTKLDNSIPQINPFTFHSNKHVIFFQKHRPIDAGQATISRHFKTPPASRKINEKLMFYNVNIIRNAN